MGKRVGEEGPKAHSKNSDFGTPMFRYSLVAFQWHGVWGRGCTPSKVQRAQRSQMKTCM